jgi:hypothetical protein
MIHNCNNNEKDCKKDSNKEEKTINNSNNEIITEVINQTNDNDEEQNEKNEKTKKTPTPKNGKTENNEGSKKILDKKVKITKNNNKFIGPDGKPDFKNIPYMEDIVEFDKNKFKKPTPYYSIQHDKFLIPPIEEFKRNQIKVNPDLRSFKEVSQERTKFIKKNKASTLLTDPYKTYATKLDDFMTSNNSKFNTNACNKNIASFIETGLPENIPEPENKGHTENCNATSSKISNKSNTES